MYTELILALSWKATEAAAQEGGSSSSKPSGPLSHANGGGNHMEGVEMCRLAKQVGKEESKRRGRSKNLFEPLMLKVVNCQQIAFTIMLQTKNGYTTGRKKIKRKTKRMKKMKRSNPQCACPNRLINPAFAQLLIRLIMWCVWIHTKSKMAKSKVCMPTGSCKDGTSSLMKNGWNPPFASLCHCCSAMRIERYFSKILQGDSAVVQC